MAPAPDPDPGERVLTTVASALIRTASELPIPDLGEFFPPAIAFQGTLFEFNRISLVRIVAALALCLLFWAAARRATLVPGRAQGAAEMALDFVRVNVAEEVLGKTRARAYTPLLTTMFFAIFAMNITGVLPLLNIASTSVVAMPMLLAIVSWVAFVYAGIKEHGALGYVRTTLFPAGVPWPIYVILAPIELISTFILRPATLTIRLMANMLAGHLLLVLFFGLTNYMLVEATAALKPVALLTFGVGFAFTLFEIFVSALQAYLFVLLTAVYISLSQEAH